MRSAEGSFILVLALLISGVAILSTIQGRESAGLSTTINPAGSTSNAILVLSVVPRSLNVGDQLLFNVTIRNNATFPIYYLGLCGSSLSFNVSPAYLVERKISPRCLCATGLLRLNSSQSATLYAPNCASGYSYTISQAGEAAVAFNFTWWKGRNFSGSNHTYFSSNLRLR